MEEFFARALDQMWGRMGGPLHLRFILQPLMASLIAARAGFRDARAQRPPYFQTLLTQPAQRHALIRDGLRDVGKVFIVAFLIDVVYQIVMLRWFYPGQALIVAFVLAAIPYVLVRGPTARIAGRRRRSVARREDASAA